MPNKKTEVIKAGESYYAGGTVSKIAKKDIPLSQEWKMFEANPEPEQPKSLSPMTAAFLAQPEITGGVTGFLSE